MILDCTRGTYTAPLVLSDGRKVKIRWYTASPGAQRFPHGHKLRQRTWWKQETPGPLGEQRPSVWHDGKNYLELPGTEFHGDPSAFIDLPSEPRVTPCGHWKLSIAQGHAFSCIFTGEACVNGVVFGGDVEEIAPDGGGGGSSGCIGVLVDEETIVQATEDVAVEIVCPPTPGCIGVLVDEETIVQATEDVAVEIVCPPTPGCMGVLVDEETIVQATEDDAVEIECPP